MNQEIYAYILNIKFYQKYKENNLTNYLKMRYILDISKFDINL